jgi:hypothetical protein
VCGRLIVPEYLPNLEFNLLEIRLVHVKAIVLLIVCLIGTIPPTLIGLSLPKIEINIKNFENQFVHVTAIVLPVP